MPSAPLVDVVIDRVAAGLDRPFTYRRPDAWAAVGPGWRVLVPFGRSQAAGLVVAEHEGPTAGPVKDLLRPLDPYPLLPPDLVAVAVWMRDRWGCLLPQALRAAVPAPVRHMPAPDPPWLYAGAEPTRGSERRRLWTYLAERGGATREEALAATGVSPAVLRAMETAGQVRRGVPPRPPLPPPSTRLTPDQERAVAAILAQLDTGGEVLVEGVTGSGKTEVYLAAVAATLARGRQAIVLVPEIALTPQMQARFEQRFPGRVAVFHSAMADGVRVREWHRVRTGEAEVVLGARSAVFAPCPRLGLVVVDEEHEPTYKQDEHPRYHAREVARERARRVGAVLVLGSATPSLETAWAARTGQVAWVRLRKRVGGRPLARAEVVDMRAELKAGHREMFSRALKDAVAECLAAGDQAILLLNRRGFSTSVVCRACGQPRMCPRCAVSLTLHATERRLLCHYCLHEEPVPTVCPACGSPQIRQFGVGTERVVEEVRRLWPDARVLRADADSLRRRGSHRRLFEAFLARRADVLVGTQVIAKGLHWPGVTLVGVVAADLGLTLPDFRAAERTFALLTQAAGRAGRGDRPGRVIIQTYNPEHYSVAAAARQDFDAFYAEELGFRELLGYPPFGHLLLVEAADEDPARAAAEAERARTVLAGRSGLVLLGPAPAPLARLRGRWRMHLLVKARELVLVLDAARALLDDNPRLSLTVDPYHLL
ncbi:MAG: primosomal protein N' [Actinomycetia bacterium]|nr:primosomal protein N' [Actinomycetes bacterium]